MSSSSSGLSGSMEDYLEAILVCKLRKGRVRITDIAAALNVSRPSVVSAVSQLEGMGHLSHQRYGDVKLTPDGEVRAWQIYNRHLAIRAFLQDILGTAPPIAEEDACRMEHNLHSDTIRRMERYVSFIRQELGTAEWLERFRLFLGE